MDDAERRWPNLVSMFFARADARGDEPFLWAKHDGAYRPLTWRRTAQQVVQLARGLRALGIERGDRVVILSENRPEWLIADLATMAIGAITTPSYTTFTENDHLHILENSGAKAAIVSTRRLAEKFLPAAHTANDLETVIAIERPRVPQHLSLEVLSWDDVLASGEAGHDVVDEASAWQRSDTACIIYTSGTGGAPKGVMLHHGAILHNCEGARDALMELGLGHEVFLSFLPLSHSYEHSPGQFFPIDIGAEIYYAEGPEHLASNILEVRPTIMIAVPRFYELTRNRITLRLSRAGTLQTRLFWAAHALGCKRYANGGRLPLHERALDLALDTLVRDKVRARFGGRLKGMVSGGGPLAPDVGLFFTALGVRILQGYGQTESAPVVSVNRPSRPKMHTVGPPLRDTEVRIADDGEILVRGELVMQGYWGDERMTAETIRDGWLHTGDIGLIDEDGHLRIVDRKKDIIVNSGGDNISPQRVEGRLTLEPEIGQAAVFGDRRPHLVALLVPDAEWMRNWAEENAKPSELAELANDADFRAAVGAVVERVNAQLSIIEKVRRFTILREPFTVENGQITPTLKVRRHAIRRAYDDVIDGMYG
jgi:long-chain acyl-CoA synthetase